MSKSRRVLITGLSVCCPIGKTVDAFWTNALAGRSGVVELNRFEIGDGCSRIAGVVEDFMPETLFYPDIPEEQPDRAYLMAEYCVRRVLEDARLTGAKDREECGLYVSSAIGQMGSMERKFSGRRRSQPSQSAQGRSGAFSFNALAGRAAERCGLRGGHLVLPTGCVGGCDSVSYGYKLVKTGLADRVVVGAAEAPLTPLAVAAFARIGATSTRSCPPEEASCPFDRRRDGFVLAEGAAMLLLEAEEVAKRRGAPIVAEVSGAGSVNNCYHMTDIHPDGEAIAEACRRSLKDAKVDPAEIDFVNSHGSSTPQNDVAEAAALKKVLSARVREVPVTSLKSQTGHALSAANAIEIVSTVKSITSEEIPPTINLQNQDPGCDITVVASKLRHPIKRALKISSGFSGIHTAVLISRYEEEP